MRGSTNRLDGAWLGFDSVDFDAVYSFSAPRTVGRVTLGSLQEQVSRIFFPGRIEVSVAGNDSVFRVAGVLDAGLPVEDAEIRSHEFSASFTPAPARYVRVRAVNTRVCPPWHPSHGDRAWLLIDETVIQ
jgi:hexosaminidase